MNKASKKKKIVWQQYISIAFFILIGVACGILMRKYMASVFAQEMSLWKKYLLLCGLILIVYLAIFVQAIIHEAGHFLFGRLSGYKFSSFRIMNFIWVKENNKLKFKRLTLVGTGGQCLMEPPEMKNGKLPVALYNMGGSMMNILAGFIFLGVYALAGKVPFLSFTMSVFAIIGFASAIINGIPMRLGIVDNDGYNAFELRKNKDAMQAFWVQLKTNEQISKGVRLKDMPAEWFVVPTDDEMKNSMVAVVGVFACNRLMDEHNFDDADKLMAHLLDIDSGIVGLHRNLIICDRLFCELIGENRWDTVEVILTNEQKKFMKSMKKFPTVLRTQYAYSLLSERDKSMANNVETQFNKCAKSYPYPSEIQAERELIEIAKRRACVQ